MLVKYDEQLLVIDVDQIIDVLSTRDFLDESPSTHDAIIGNLVTQAEIIVVVDVDKVYELSQPKKVSRTITSGNKILLVEDTDSIRNRIAQGLIESGFDVEVAVDGMDGLRKIAEHKCGFNVIISDIEMPKMNGYEFARKIRSISQLKNVPLIAFTTKNNAEELKEAKAAGFSTFLEKSKGKLLNLLVNECLANNKRKSA